MITQIEGDRAGQPVRVYHRAGLTEQGPDTKFTWTHPASERATCVACTDGRIPDEVKRSKR